MNMGDGDAATREAAALCTAQAEPGEQNSRKQERVVSIQAEKADEASTMGVPSDGGAELSRVRKESEMLKEELRGLHQHFDEEMVLMEVQCQEQARRYDAQLEQLVQQANDQLASMQEDFEEKLVQQEEKYARAVKVLELQLAAQNGHLMAVECQNQAKDSAIKSLRESLEHARSQNSIQPLHSLQMVERGTSPATPALPAPRLLDQWKSVNGESRKHSLLGCQEELFRLDYNATPSHARTANFGKENLYQAGSRPRKGFTTGNACKGNTGPLKTARGRGQADDCIAEARNGIAREVDRNWAPKARAAKGAHRSDKNPGEAHGQTQTCTPSEQVSSEKTAWVPQEGSEVQFTSPEEGEAASVPESEETRSQASFETQLSLDLQPDGLKRSSSWVHRALDFTSDRLPVEEKVSAAAVTKQNITYMLESFAHVSDSNPVTSRHFPPRECISINHDPPVWLQETQESKFSDSAGPREIFALSESDSTLRSNASTPAASVHGLSRACSERTIRSEPEDAATERLFEMAELDTRAVQGDSLSSVARQLLVEFSESSVSSRQDSCEADTTFTLSTRMAIWLVTIVLCALGVMFPFGHWLHPRSRLNCMVGATCASPSSFSVDKDVGKQSQQRGFWGLVNRIYPEIEGQWYESEEPLNVAENAKRLFLGILDRAYPEIEGQWYSSEVFVMDKTASKYSKSGMWGLVERMYPEIEGHWYVQPDPVVNNAVQEPKDFVAESPTLKSSSVGFWELVESLYPQVKGQWYEESTESSAFTSVCALEMSVGLKAVLCGSAFVPAAPETQRFSNKLLDALFPPQAGLDWEA